MNKRYREIIAALSIMVVLALCAGCSERITETTGGEAELRISAAGGAGAELSRASSFTLTITGPGIINPIKTDLIYENGLLIGTVTVPAGPKRVFLIEGFDEAGALIYSGRTVADVNPDEVTSLSIDIEPRIPMVKLSPSYYFEPYGSYLQYRVRVHNMAQLRSIAIQIDNYSEKYGTQYGFYANDVVINPMISDFASLTWYNLEAPPGVVLNVSHRYAGNSIIDPSGYRELATVVIRTYTPYLGPTLLNAIFEPQVISMVGIEGDTLDQAIYSENSNAFLFEPTEQRSGYWKMDWDGQYPNIVLDSSGNNLDGSAAGTTWDEGMWGSARTFDGNDDFITIPDNPLLDLDEGLTVSFWIKAVPYANEDTGAVISKMSGDGPINYQILFSWLPGAVEQGNCRFIFRYGNPPYQYYSAEVPDIANNEWRHVIFSYDFGKPSSAILVIDYSRIISGSWLDDSGGAEATVNDGQLLFGKQDNTDQPYYLAGGLDEFELYSQSFGWQALQYIFFPR
ncbi:MAG: LamG-like jellyroll fold domain-containing protein [Candidatus Krumholzibacteriales bacterium]